MVKGKQMFGASENRTLEKQACTGSPTVDVSFVLGVENDQVDLRNAVQKVMRSAPPAKTYEVLVICPAEYHSAWETAQHLADEFVQVICVRCKPDQERYTYQRSGFELAKGELILTIDTSGHDDPTAIPLVLDKIDEGYDLVGCRTQRRIDTWHASAPKPSSTPTPMPNPIESTFKCYRREVGDRLHLTGDTFHVFDSLADHEGFRVTEILVDDKEAEASARQSTFGAVAYAMLGIVAFTSTYFIELSAAMEALVLTGSIGFLGVAGALTFSGVHSEMQASTPLGLEEESKERMEGPRFLDRPARGRNATSYANAVEEERSVVG
ncbi:MAG: hypothetical protein AAF483_22980 [Planctomycetota bacterium]